MRWRERQFIAHRGNYEGPNTVENVPDRLAEVAREKAVEVDAWYVGGSFFLGHEGPEHPIDKFFLFSSNILVHCKNIDCLE